jgi:hypothetical protein
MAQHIQQLGANVAFLAKDINEPKFESAKQEQSQINCLLSYKVNTTNIQLSYKV